MAGASVRAQHDKQKGTTRWTSYLNKRSGEPQARIELTTARLRIECSTPELLWRRTACMPWRGFEPRRLAAPPPQDGVSTSFTTRATLPTERGRRGSNPRPLERQSSALTKLSYVPSK